MKYNGTHYISGLCRIHGRYKKNNCPPWIKAPLFGKYSLLEITTGNKVSIIEEVTGRWVKNQDLWAILAAVHYWEVVSEFADLVLYVT